MSSRSLQLFILSAKGVFDSSFNAHTWHTDRSTDIKKNGSQCKKHSNFGPDIDLRRGTLIPDWYLVQGGFRKFAFLINEQPLYLTTGMKNDISYNRKNFISRTKIITYKRSHLERIPD